MALPLVFVWPYAFVFWILFLVVFLPEFRLERRARRMAQAHREQDRGSVHIIVLAGRAAFGVGVLAAIILPVATIDPGRSQAFVAGLALLAAGAALRLHARRMLGRHFTGTVAVHRDQPVIRRGVYRWIRHPAYAGAAMIMTGIGFALTNWLSVLVLALVPTIGYGVRISAEERAMLATIGEPYRAYMQRTKRFVPFLF
jgi:protein-S-isoprenylcysteine O-methyltransferase Ste14